MNDPSQRRGDRARYEALFGRSVTLRLPRIIAIDKVKDNLYVLRGGGGHSVVFITATGVVVVDTMNPGWGRTILETITTLTDKPVTTLINTHGHADHVSGNVEFPATVDIIVQRNTKKNMRLGPYFLMALSSGSRLPYEIVGRAAPVAWTSELRREAKFSANRSSMSCDVIDSAGQWPNPERSLFCSDVSISGWVPTPQIRFR